MSGEILFRGKRIDNGEWVEGFYISTNETHYIVYREQFDDDLLLAPQNICIPVYPDTICQYTGLTDINGVKIFEGDILNENDYLFVIVYEQKWAKFKLLHNGKAIQYPAWNGGILMEVIGNIFDNPELLNGEG